jgi:glycosyltransferase involved in cell wall biosynthesis
MSVWRGEDDSALARPESPSLEAEESLKVAVLGGLDVVKGFDVLLAAARQAKRRKLPIQFILIGHSIDDESLRRSGVIVHGRYRESGLDAILRSYAPHVVFQPAIWPETWSFATSAALRHRLPVYAFDIGAIAQRLGALGLDTTLPLAMAKRPDDLLDRLLSVRHKASRHCRAAGTNLAAEQTS